MTTETPEANGAASETGSEESCLEDAGHLWNVSSSGPTVNNFFHGPRFGSATIGFANTNGGRATGRLPRADQEELRGAFIEPPRFAAMLDALGSHRMVVLAGAAGRGKRTSALRLLRRSVKGDIYLLSPRLSWSELAERTYQRGCGYALIDHQAVNGPDSFGRQLLRERLAECEAHLVITTARSSELDEWELPDLILVLRERVSVELPDDALSLLTSALAEVVRIGDVAELARRLDGGEPATDAVRHLDTTAGEAVRQWFDAAPSRRQVAEVTIMAFTLAAPVRDFDRMLGRLLREMTETPAATTDPDDRDATMRRGRESVTGPASLIVRRSSGTELVTRTHFEFAVPAYHRHVVRELWERYSDDDLWTPVRRWLDTAVDDGDWCVTFGLAALSDVDAGEVLDVIDPWSRRVRGTNGQFAASLVLAAMAYQDASAPLALRIATQWILGGEPARQVTAAAAFGGHLGVRFPHDAAKRLWVLSVRPDTPDGVVDHAIPELFVGLVRAESSPSVVLNLLAARLTARNARHIPPQRIQRIALRVMTARDDVTGRSALGHFISQSRDRLEHACTVWAELLRNRPTRRAAFRLFATVIRDLTEHEEYPEKPLRLLARGIGAALPDGERALFEAGIRHACRAHRDDSRGPEAALLTQLIDDVLDRQEGITR